MMASNNDPRKKQKRTLLMVPLKRAAKLAVDGDVIVDGDSSSSSTPVHVISLSFGTIFQKFPDLLMQLLPYIANRTIFNAIASCNRDTHEKSKAMLPPWPNHYRLPLLPPSNGDLIAVWSPDGTCVASAVHRREGIIIDGIIIVDQHHGIIHRTNSNGTIVSALKFSPDGRLLVSAGRGGIVRLWDNVTENYEQLQKWNMREYFGTNWTLFNIDMSACSKYIVMATNSSNRVVLKRVENCESIKSLAPQLVMMNIITNVMFSVDYRAVFICGSNRNSSVIKLWRPYLDNTDEDSLTTLWEQKKFFKKYFDPKVIVSHDKMMIAIQDPNDRNKGWLLSMDNNYSCTVQKLNVPGNDVPVLLQFTPDNKFIIYATKNGLEYWSIAIKKFMDNKCLFYNKRFMNNLPVVNCSPDIRQFIVKDDFQMWKQGYLYIKSIF